MTAAQTTALLTTPLGKLPPDVAAELIAQLLAGARDLGLNVNAAIKPAAWLRLPGIAAMSIADLDVALTSLAERGTRLNGPADLLTARPDPDASSWAKVEARLNTGNRELAPVLDGREMLAILDDQGIAWDYTHADHPLERARVRERYITALRRDRTLDPRITGLVQARVDAGIPHALAVEQILKGPGLAVREEQVAPGQRRIEEALQALASRMIPAQA